MTDEHKPTKPEKQVENLQRPVGKRHSLSCVTGTFWEQAAKPRPFRRAGRIANGPNTYFTRVRSKQGSGQERAR